MRTSGHIIPPVECLIVEDDALQAESFQWVLEDAGAASVSPVSTEADALDIIVNRRPDVALLDVDIDGGTSLGVATALLAKDVPVAFISGHAAVDLPEPFSGMTFLQKPVTRNDLVALVNMLAAMGDDDVASERR